jgi:hypothetical protein
MAVRAWGITAEGFQGIMPGTARPDTLFPRALLKRDSPIGCMAGAGHIAGTDDFLTFNERPFRESKRRDGEDSCGGF